MNKIKLTMILVIFCLFLVPLFAGAETVTIQNGRMSVDLKEASLVSVARDIEKQAGISFKGDESLLEEKVSVSFKNLSLEEGIKRILANMNYSLMFDNQGQVSEVMIMSEGSGAVAPQPQVRPAPVRAGTPSPAERRSIVRRPRPSSPLVTGGSRTPTARSRTTLPRRSSAQRPAQATQSSPQAAEESNLPEAFRTIENAPPSEGPVSSDEPLPPAFRVIESAEPPAGKVKSAQQTPEASKVQKEENAPKEESSSKEQKP